MTSLAGKVAVVTGGTRGIGLAIAAAFVARGIDVLATGRSDAHFAAAREFVAQASAAAAHGRRAGRPAPGRFECAVADVRDYAQVERVMATAVDRFGGLDILVNNAGIGIFCEVARADAGAVARGDRHQPHRRLLLLSRRDPAPAPSRRRVDHQHQQPRREEPVSRRRCLLRLEGRPQRVQRGADAGSPLRRDPGELRAARVGAHRVRRDALRRRAASGSWIPGDVAQVVVDLVAHDPRSLPSRVEIRPSTARRR